MRARVCACVRVCVRACVRAYAFGPAYGVASALAARLGAYEQVAAYCMARDNTGPTVVVFELLGKVPSKNNKKL